MKPRSQQFLPRTLVVCLAPLIACSTAQAKVVYHNESRTVNGTSDVWTLPAGGNLLTGVSPSPATCATHEGSDATWTTVIDGSLGSFTGAPATSCTPNNNTAAHPGISADSTVTFPLDLSGVNSGGHNITSFDSYCSWADSGRDNQNYTLQYSTVADPATFITIANVANETGGDSSTHTRVTDDTGFLAMGVHSIRLIFGNGTGNQENGFTGYREFVLQSAPAVVAVSTEANNNNSFFLDTSPGANLLTGLTPLEAGPAVHENSSPDWVTVTDGSVGNYGDAITSCTPDPNATLTYPLDLTNHPAGRTIHSFDSYCAWGSDGRDDQNYLLEYSTIGAPGTFIPIQQVTARTVFNNSGGRVATHARVTSNGGPLATGVHSIRLTFLAQENGYAGYREFVLKDTPINKTTYESNLTNVWTLPTGTNLLTGTPTLEGGPNPQEGTSSDWATLSNGSVGDNTLTLTGCAPLIDSTLTYSFDVSGNTQGYNITSIDAYAAWANSGRDNQNFTILYSKVGDDTFIPIETINNQTGKPSVATHSRVLPASGFLATNVDELRFYFNKQENGFVGYRELVVLGSPVSLSAPLTWSGLGGSGNNATWADATATNWIGGVYNSGAPLTFPTSGINTNITLATNLSAASLNFTNDNTKAYIFGGVSRTLTVTNGVSLTGSGSATFNNFLTASGIEVSGSGTLTLSRDNTLNGTVTVSNGTLVLASSFGLDDVPLTQTGGTVKFTSSQATVANISGTAGAMVLGNVTGSVDTLLSVGGDNATSTYAGSISDASGTANGSLLKAGTGTVTLSGTNTYTGTTTVADGGGLTFAKVASLPGGGTIVQGTSSLGLYVGGPGEFALANVNAFNTSGFEPDATLGLDTSSGNAVFSDSLGGTAKIAKQGANSLTLAAANTFSKGFTVAQGVLILGNTTGTSMPGDLTMGNLTFDVYANMLSSNQFAPTSLLKFNAGDNEVQNAKFQLRGTSQTIAGVDNVSAGSRAIIQNDEIGTPGFTVNPDVCSLTINTADSVVGIDHSFRGIIRNADGGSLSIIKQGPGTQELVNGPLQGHSYNGATTIQAGTFRLSFGGANSGFGSNIAIEDPGTFNLHSSNGGYDFNRLISGAGELLVTGTNPVALTNGLNSWTGGTTVDGGFFALKTVNGDDIGAGNAGGQTCIAGAMTPLNVINLINGGTLSLDAAAPLGQSTMLPAFAPTIIVNQGSKIFGGTNTVAFVPNITLDGGSIELTSGANTGGFDTNLAPVGTVTVVGSAASTIFTNPDFLPGGATPSGFANMSLGSIGAPGTTFAVANVTGDAAADLTVSSILRNVSNIVSPLTKSGPGTMLLSGENTYTGDTTVTGGELTVSGNSIVDTNRLILDGGRLGLSANETVGTLFYAGIQQIAGTYGSTASTATFKDDSRFSGTAVLTVITNPGTDPYALWSAAIGNPSDRDRTDDPDADGFTNVQEYLFGTSPVANTGSLSTFEKSGSNLIVRWSQRTPGTYVVQESTTLANPWSPSAVTPANATDQNGLYSADYVRKEAIIPINSVRKFVRVKATE
ncbi:MAG: autotransporter-associated beta strand repeat-containing protein [Verrucomicrobiota bacterium]